MPNHRIGSIGLTVQDEGDSSSIEDCGAVSESIDTDADPLANREVLEDCIADRVAGGDLEIKNDETEPCSWMVLRMCQLAWNFAT